MRRIIQMSCWAFNTGYARPGGKSTRCLVTDPFAFTCYPTVPNPAGRRSKAGIQLRYPSGHALASTTRGLGRICAAPRPLYKPRTPLDRRTTVPPVVSVSLAALGLAPFGRCKTNASRTHLGSRSRHLSTYTMSATAAQLRSVHSALLGK